MRQPVRRLLGISVFMRGHFTGHVLPVTRLLCLFLLTQQVLSVSVMPVSALSQVRLQMSLTEIKGIIHEESWENLNTRDMEMGIDNAVEQNMWSVIFREVPNSTPPDCNYVLLNWIKSMSKLEPNRKMTFSQDRHTEHVSLCLARTDYKNRPLPKISVLGNNILCLSCLCLSVWVVCVSPCLFVLHTHTHTHAHTHTHKWYMCWRDDSLKILTVWSVYK